MYHEGVRQNDPVLRRIARLRFAPLFFARGNTRYARIVLFVEHLQQIMPIELFTQYLYQQVFCRNTVGKYQGIDAFLEEINRLIKWLAPHNPKIIDWKIASQNVMALVNLRNYMLKISDRNPPADQRRATPEYTAELAACRKLLRSNDFGRIIVGRSDVFNITNKPLNPEAKTLFSTGKQRIADSVKLTLEAGYTKTAKTMTAILLSTTDSAEAVEGDIE
jgi:hypothetical protein